MLRLGLSHLNEHKFKHNFQDCINPLCTYSLEFESLYHFFLYSLFHKYMFSLINDANMTKSSDNEIVELLLYVSPKYDSDRNHKILSSCVNFILK